MRRNGAMLRQNLVTRLMRVVHQDVEIVPERLGEFRLRIHQSMMAGRAEPVRVGIERRAGRRAAQRPAQAFQQLPKSPR